jgi:hypothetical protein
VLQPKNESQRWVSLWLVAMGIFVAMIIFLAVIPSWWLYFADATLKWTDNFTLSLGVRKIVLSKQVIRDVIVVVWYGVVLLAGARMIGIWNKRNPKILAGDESKREATGGYK